MAAPPAGLSCRPSAPSQLARSTPPRSLPSPRCSPGALPLPQASCQPRVRPPSPVAPGARAAAGGPLHWGHRAPGPRATASGASGTESIQLEERGPVVVVDNYDSFTYNLCQYLGNLGCHYVVYRNDDITLEDLDRLQPRGILISPGPGTPDDSGISLDVVRRLGPKVPLFGVCMGLQCIGQAYGGEIVRAPQGVMHGKTSPVFHNQQDVALGLLAGLPSPFTACRYHSLVIDRDTFPEEELEITAWTEDGLVMGARHRQFPHLEGVQFHPESVITSNGMDIVRNFLKTVEKYWH